MLMSILKTANLLRKILPQWTWNLSPGRASNSTTETN